MSNELGLRAFRSELGGDALALRDVHVVIAGAMYREDRDIRPRKRHRGDVAKLGVGPRSRMTHHLRQNIVEVGHHLLGRHRHVVLAIEVDGDVHSSVRARWIVTQRDHCRQVTAG